MEELKNKVKQSETKTLIRSDISFASYNPRKLSDEARKALKKNIKENGLLGGIIINERTGNIVSGHQRVSILDEVNGFEKGKDYPIKVEVIDVDDKKEKELNIFMNSRATQGEMDYSKLALILPEIDAVLAGLDEVDLSMIEIELPEAVEYEIQTFEPQFEKKQEAQEKAQSDNSVSHPAETVTNMEMTDEEKKAHVKAIKEKVKENATIEGEPYFTVSFDTYENKVFFLERFGIDPQARFVKGEELADSMDETE